MMKEKAKEWLWDAFAMCVLYGGGVLFFLSCRKVLIGEA